MRKILLLTIILLVFAAWAVAQQGVTSPTAPPRDNTQASQQAAPSENTTEGCLGGSAGNFTVTDKAGTTYQLQLPPNADTSKLSQHIGQEVRVTGSTSSAGSSSSSSPGMAGSSGAAGSAPSAGAASSTQPSINVTRMEKVADTCGAGTSNANPSK
jgi:hypothetical protein